LIGQPIGKSVLDPAVHVQEPFRLQSPRFPHLDAGQGTLSAAYREAAE